METQLEAEYQAQRVAVELSEKQKTLEHERRLMMDLDGNLIPQG